MTVLIGTHVRLEPLTLSHVDNLFTHTGKNDLLWRDLPVHTPQTINDMRQIVTAALIERDAGEREPFAVIVNGEVIGSSSYLDQVPVHKRIEIGWTYYAQEFWRTAINTESKYLLMREAFEVRGCDRVAFKTDIRNVRSQDAIERVGGQREGVSRHVVLRVDGTPRDSVHYSVLRDEWPFVKTKLESALA